MKKVRKYWNMIVTAVICFAVSLLPGRKAGKRMEALLAGGQALRNPCPESRSRNLEKESLMKVRIHARDLSSKKAAACRHNRRRPRLKRVFFWLGGPGDRGLPQPFN